MPDAIALLRFARCSRATALYMCSDDDAGWAGLWRRHALFVWDLVPTLDLRCIEVVRKPLQQRRGPSYGRVASNNASQSLSSSQGGASFHPLDKPALKPLHGGPSSPSASADARASAQSLRAQVTHHCAATHRSFAFINRVCTCYSNVYTPQASGLFFYHTSRVFIPSATHTNVI